MPQALTEQQIVARIEALKKLMVKVIKEADGNLLAPYHGIQWLKHRQALDEARECVISLSNIRRVAPETLYAEFGLELPIPQHGDDK